MTDETKKPAVYFHKRPDGSPARRWPSGRVRYRAKVRWPDGKRDDIAIPDEHCYSEERAAEHAAHIQETLDAGGAAALAKAKREVAEPSRADIDAADAWVDAWLDGKKARGQTSVRDRRAHYALHIRPALDAKHVRDWTSDDVRVLVAALDAKIAAGTISAKTARNIWGTASKMAADSCKSKVAALRVRTDNPAKDVEGPERGDDKSKQFVYPNEFLQLVACEDIPVRWRRAVALAVYLFPRAGELRALRWESVDLEHGTVHIHEAFERRSRATKGTKTKTVRRFAVDPAILPLLRAMHEETKGKGLVCPLPNRMADRLRGWLKKAGIARRELLDATPTTKPLGFHDLRASGLTWMAVRGDDPLKIMQRAGHEDFATTQIYIRTAEAVREGFGTVFPELPASLLAGAETPTSNAVEPAQAPDDAGALSTPPVYVAAKSLERGAGHGIRSCGESSDETQEREIRTPDPLAADAGDASTSGNVAERRSVDTNVDRAGGLDVARAAALANAIETLLGAGLLDEARPLARELAATLRATVAAMMPRVISLPAVRAERARR